MRLKSIALRASLVAGALVFVGGVAAASIPDASGVIHGCRKTNGGALTVIDSATQTCPGGTVALNWSQTGPQGPAGPAGTNGISGYEVVTQSVSASDGETGRDFATFILCPSGKRAFGGGGGVNTGDPGQGTAADVVVQYSGPTDGAATTGWRVQTRRVSDATTAYTLRVWAICGNAS
jgi:hypothetical protein